MSREAISTRVIKWFYNISGPLDEYRRAQANQIGNWIAIVLTGFDLLLVIVASVVFLGTNSYEIAFLVTLFALLAAVLTVCGFILYAVARHHLTDVEVEDRQEPHARQQAIKEAIITGVSCCLFMYALDVVGDWLPAKGPLLPVLTNSGTIVSALIYGAVMGLMILGINLGEIKRGKDKAMGPVQQFLDRKWGLFLVILVVTFVLLSLAD